MNKKPAPRATPTKLRIEEIFQATHHPLTLKQLHALVTQSLPKTAFSTTFRIVEQLERHCLISRVNWKDRGALYEWSQRPHHHHVVCQSCESVTDIDDKNIGYDEKKLAKETGFIITDHIVEFTGICKPCQTNYKK